MGGGGGGTCSHFPVFLCPRCNKKTNVPVFPLTFLSSVLQKSVAKDREKARG